MTKSNDANPNRMVMRFRRDALTPNKWNSALFPDSLSGKSIEVLAESLKQGQRVPIEITDSHVIVDGERRWRAAELAGIEMVDVIYVGDLTDDEILDRVLDSCTSVRQPSPREKALIYTAVYQRLQGTLGRKHGERSPNGDLSEPNELKSIAIKRAGISSIKMAERLVTIFERAPDGIQRKVNAGEMSVAAGYEEVPKRSREKPSEEPRPDDETGITDVTEDGVWVNPFAKRGRLPDGTVVTHDEELSPETLNAHQYDGDDHDGKSLSDIADDAGVGGDPPSEAQEFHKVSEREASESQSPDRYHEADDLEVAVEDALEILAAHLEEVAAKDYSTAKSKWETWMRRIFQRVKSARQAAA